MLPLSCQIVLVSECERFDQKVVKPRACGARADGSSPFGQQQSGGIKFFCWPV
jgi:hypothetical protein